MTTQIQARLAAYNNEHATMNLVLFDDAILHVCRTSKFFRMSQTADNIWSHPKYAHAK